MRQKLYKSHNLPSFIRSPEDFVYHCLNDLFFLCSYVMAHGKKTEYRDIPTNPRYMQLCDWMDWRKNPIMQKLDLMSRDSLKSTVGRAMIIQELLRASVDGSEAMFGIITGDSRLSKRHLVLIRQELLRNEMLQAYFAGYIPKSKDDADEMSGESIRWGKVGVDTGSLKRSLSGNHYMGIWFDNFMNEVNSTTVDLRLSCVNRFKSQGPLLRKDGWKLVSETPWEPDDLSGEILDPGDNQFDYRTIHRKSPAIFIAKSGYSVFACGAVNKQGIPNFPATCDEKYLSLKRGEMGDYLYKRQYELLPIASEDYSLRRKWFITYDELPWNYIRNIAVDCAGTKSRDSSYSGVSICDWGPDQDGHISYAEKRKVSPMELFKWLCELWDNSREEERYPTYMLIEREKYGIFLADLFETNRRDIPVWLIPLRGVPRNIRLESLVQPAEQGHWRFRTGLHKMRTEWISYYKGKDKDVDLLDTLFLHLQGRIIPKKMDKPTDAERVRDAFDKQIAGDLAYLNDRPSLAARF